MTGKAYRTPCGTIRYWTSGREASPVSLIFLPGLTADHRLFDRQIAYFEGKYRVLVWDAPAHGESWPFDFSFTLADKARWLKEILRRATKEDTEKVYANKAREHDALMICRKKVVERGLEMKVIASEYSFDDSRVIFFFTADGRVDFRDLVKDLAAIFHMRIELRQVGARDETKIVGGMGPCGRPLCCHSWLSDFVPVAIKMAKEQNLSLNPQKISGVALFSVLPKALIVPKEPLIRYCMASSGFAPRAAMMIPPMINASKMESSGTINPDAFLIFMPGLPSYCLSSRD